MDTAVRFLHPGPTTLGSLNPHTAVVVKLPCSVMMVLDPTALQFGWKETLASGYHYLNHRINIAAFRTTDPEPQPPGSQFVTPQLPETPSFKPTRKEPDLRWEFVMDTLVISLLPQIDARYGGVKNLLKLNASDFTAARTAVLDAAKRGLRKLGDEVDLGAKQIIFPKSTARDDPSEMQDYEKVEVVWCPEEVCNLAQKSPAVAERVRHAWKARWEEVVEIQ